MSTVDIVNFIAEYVDSIEQLEVLLLLRAHNDREWTPSDVNEVIRSTESSIAKHLHGWVSAGLLRMVGEAPGRFTYSPSSPELSAVVEELANSYRDRRTAVIEYIYSKPLRGILDFSQAFKFRKDR